MAQFPRTEPQVIVPAQDMATGLAANAAVYPAPPVAPADLQTRMAAYITARDAAVAAAAAAEQTTAAKNEALQALTDDMKADIRYAENTVNYDDDKLKLIGWAGRAAKTSLEAPGQARLAVECDGDNWHGADRYEADMERQRKLERCGWEFFRVRESAFYANRVEALKGLWSALQERAIEPSIGGGRSEEAGGGRDGSNAMTV